MEKYKKLAAFKVSEIQTNTCDEIYCVSVKYKNKFFSVKSRKLLNQSRLDCMKHAFNVLIKFINTELDLKLEEKNG